MQNLSLLENNSQLFSVDNHLSFNFNDHIKPNLATFSSLTETKSYTPITGCVFEHILTTTNLTNYEKLYYLTADSLSIISKNKGGSRSCALPSEDWANRLGCSRSLIFTMQSSLVKKGYFIINKDWNEIGLNKRNLITPTLPTLIFNHLNEKYPDRVGEHAPYNPLSECKRSYLDRTKLFIKLNYDLLKIITANEYLNSGRKVMWLSFYTRCYKNYMLQGSESLNVGKYSYKNDSYFSFITSYRELSTLYSCNSKNLSKSIRALEKLGFIKAQNIYIRKRYGNNGNYSNNDDSCSDGYGVNDNYCRTQERQDQSLWKITLSLPKDCILELEKVKDRANLKLKDIKTEVATIENNINPRLIEDCLILGGIKFNLNLEQSDVLKSVIKGYIDDNGCGSNDASVDYTDSNDNIDITPPLLDVPSAESYIDSVMEELDVSDAENREENIGSKLEECGGLENSDFDNERLDNHFKNLPPSSSPLLSLSSSPLSSLEAFDSKEDNDNGIKSDPHVAKSALLYNKYLISKIKDIKSNLGTSSIVTFNNFLRRLSKDEADGNLGSKKKERKTENQEKEFNIHSELIRKKLKILPKDKADKARKFAYSLISKKLANGYAASLSKHELAKQIIHHAATWKPTKLGLVSREKEIDTALSVAWKKIVGGTWQVPLELAKAEILHYEFKAYRQKYQESGILAYEANALEKDINNLLGGWCDLKGEITKGSIGDNKRSSDNNRNDKCGEVSSDFRETQNFSGELEYDQERGDYLHIPYEEELPVTELEVNASDLLIPTPDILTLSPLHQEEIIGKDHLQCSFPSQGYLEKDNVGNQSNFALADDTRNYCALEQGDLLDSDYRRDELCNNRTFDLSHIPDEQKYLKVTGSDIKGDDSIILETTSGREYYVGLKALEMNDEGEFVMMLKPIKQEVFLNHSQKGVSFLEKSGTVGAGNGKAYSLEFRERLERKVSTAQVPPSIQQGSTDFELEDEFFEEFLRFAKKLNKEDKLK